MNRKLSKKVALVAIPVLAVGILVGGRAVVSAADRQEAQNAAQAYVPADAVLQEQETDDGAYKFRYYAESTGMVYEVEISQSSGRIRELETELRGGLGSQAVSLTEDQVRARVQELYPGAEVTGTQLGKDEGCYSYEVYFRTSEQYGSLELNAADGTVLESQVKYGTPVVNQPAAARTAETTAAEAAEITAAETAGTEAVGTAAAETAGTEAAAETTAAAETIPASSSGNASDRSQTASTIGEQRAQEIALERAEAGNATVTDLHLDREDGRLVYEGDMKDDSYRYEFEIDAQSGDVLKWEKEARRNQNTGSGTGSQNGQSSGNQNSGSQAEANTIGTDAASSIALGKAQAGDARITEIQLDREDGRTVYEGEMRDSSFEYDFEIDAYSGDVMQWDVERLGH